MAEVTHSCLLVGVGGGGAASGNWSGRQPLTGQEDDAKPMFGMAAAAKEDGSGAYVFGGVNVMEDLNDLVHIMT